MPSFLDSLKHHASSKTMPSSKDRMGLGSSARPSAPTTGTTTLAPQASATGKSTVMNGEPLVEDFQTRYTPSAAPIQRLSVPASASGSAADELPGSPSFSQDTDGDEAPAPPSFSRRSHASDMRNLETDHAEDARSYRTTSSVETTSVYRDRSSGESMFSQETSATTGTLPALQTKGAIEDADRLNPLLEDDPANFDLVAAPAEVTTGIHQLETRSELLLSKAHLETIFSEPRWLLKFTGFLNTHRPQSIATLIFYLDTLKALRAITYANAIAEALDAVPGHGFTHKAPVPTVNSALQEKADQAFEVLVREDLPAYIAHTWIQVVSVTIQKRVTGTLAPHLRTASEGLAEVFCLSDPSRKDNPIVFASEEFHRTTQYGMSYSIGRNCRFLQGPSTNPHSVRRIAEACKAGKEHSEVFMNYRRDGSPFMNLLMIAPLFDSKGVLRYFIGAQVDVSGLLKDCTDLEALSRMVARDEDPQLAAEEDARNQKDEFQSLSEMFNVAELDTVKHCGGRLHRDQVDNSDNESMMSHRPRLMLQDSSSGVPTQSTMPRQHQPTSANLRANGKLEGVYQHYLLVRPAPSLRILFTSPSLRVPGILQSPFLSRIGGSSRVHADLTQALTEGRGVTAKIRWLTRADDDSESEGRSRWIHCTPLIGHNGSVGVWMVVLVDAENTAAGEGRRRFRTAPPIASSIGGKDFDARAMKEKKERERTRIDRLVPNAYEPARGGPSDTTRDRHAAYGAGSSARKQQHIADQDRERPLSAMSNQSGRSGRSAQSGPESMSEFSFALR